MDGHRSATEVLARELDSAREQMRPVLWIRVSPDAISGSPAMLPLTPERARTVRLRAYPPGFVESDPEVWLRAMELVVHPEDWSDALKEFPDWHLGDFIQRHQEADTGAEVAFMGVLVKR